MFDIGDRVMVKDFDELVYEFATEEEIDAIQNDESDGFDCDHGVFFNIEMEEYCGREFTIIDRAGSTPVYSLESCGDWIFSPGMLVGISDIQIEESEELNAFLNEWVR